jgi:glycolate oxidase
MATSIEALVPRLTEICGAANVITDPLELRTYECDGLTSHRSVPALVVLPGTASEVASVVAACAAAGVPFVARGSGTGLSGGALPHRDGVLIVMSRMRAIIEIDPVSRRAIIEPGVTNLSVSKAAAPFGLFYAPDPSSQVICSVGGNVAENSGGAHCLKHGFTVHHVTGLDIAPPAGELPWLGDGTGVTTGYDLLGAFTGSEGTLGIVTKIVVKLMPVPEVVHLLLVAYGSTAEGGRAVSDIIGAGIVPAAIEMMSIGSPLMPFPSLAIPHLSLHFEALR